MPGYKKLSHYLGISVFSQKNIGFLFESGHGCVRWFFTGAALLRGKNVFKEIAGTANVYRNDILPIYTRNSHWEYVFKMILESTGVTKYVIWMIHKLIELSLGTLPVVLQFSVFHLAAQF